MKTKKFKTGEEIRTKFVDLMHSNPTPTEVETFFKQNHNSLTIAYWNLIGTKFKLSEDLIEEFAEFVYWESISRFQLVSFNFKQKFKNLFDEDLSRMYLQKLN